MSRGGGAFGARAVGKTIKADRAGGPEYDVIDLTYHSSDSFLKEIELQDILAEHKKSKKDNFLAGKTGQGAVVTTLKKNGTKKYLVAYDMPRTPFKNSTSVSPGKLTPAMTWVGGSESMKIAAETLATGGTKQKLNIWPNESVPCAVFSTPQQLEKSIITGLKNNHLVSKQVVAVVEEYFATKTMTKINLDDIPPAEAGQLAKYGGEVFAGVAAFRKAKVFSTAPWGTLDSFVLPLNPSFAGVDSLMIDKNGERFPVSSKAGKGAAASFVKNVLKAGLEHEHCLARGSYFAKLCKMYKESKQSGPRFGFLLLNDVLNLPRTQNGALIPEFADPVELYNEIYKGPPYSRSDDINLLLQLIRDWDGTNLKVRTPQQTTIIRNLPQSVTAFCGREIANKIMSEPKSVNQIQEIIQGKKFYQFNLNLNQWNRNGSVFFQVSVADNLKFSLIAGKGGSNDITMNQGFLNYFLE